MVHGSHYAALEMLSVLIYVIGKVGPRVREGKPPSESVDRPNEQKHLVEWGPPECEEKKTSESRDHLPYESGNPLIVRL